MNKIKIGDQCTLLRGSFLLKGVIVQHHATVEVSLENSNGTYSVIYIDKEGYSHTIADIKPEELSLI